MVQHEQPKIHPDLLQRLRRISAAYEMTAEKMLGIILATALEELDGMQDDYTVVLPVDPDDGKARSS